MDEADRDDGWSGHRGSGVLPTGHAFTIMQCRNMLMLAA
jgi:hypothetical protein